MTLKQVGIAVGAVIILAAAGYGIYKGNINALTDQQQIELAFNKLLANSPSTVKILGAVDITKISNEKLKGSDLGQTAIYADGSFTIKIDVEDVKRCYDRLEPVLAHEIFHVWQATVKSTPEQFIEMVNREKATTDWSHRTFEIEAVAWENVIRKELLEANPKEFSGMPETRELTNARYKALKN